MSDIELNRAIAQAIGRPNPNLSKDWGELYRRVVELEQERDAWTEVAEEIVASLAANGFEPSDANRERVHKALAAFDKLKGERK